MTNLPRTVGPLASGHASSYHRVFCRRRWSGWCLARALAGFLLRRWIPEGPVPLCEDDTVDEHRGIKVYGKPCHRDAVRSMHSFTAYRCRHKWVVLAILVQFPFARRRWALPVLVALYRSKEWNQRHGRRHKPPSHRMRPLLAVLVSRADIRVCRGRRLRDARTGSPGIPSGSACPTRATGPSPMPSPPLAGGSGSNGFLQPPKHHGSFSKLSRPTKAVLLYALAPAA